MTVTTGRPIAAALFVLLAVAAAGPTTGLAQAKPNLLVISIDTLRADRLGSYGYPLARTPVLDGLASEAVRFEQAFTTAPLTLPAHCSLMTGTYPLHHAVRDNSGYVLPQSRTTLAELLLKHGYQTAAFVGAFVLDSKFGLDQGFETYYDDFDLSEFENVSPGYIQRRGDEVVQAALDWLSRRDRAPFFLWVHLYDPHDPYTPPEPFASQHPGRPYDGEIAFTDQNVGTLLEGLKKQGGYENTLIVVVGDHGESLGEHQEEKHGLFVYNATLQIPLLVKLPGEKTQGSTVSEPVSLVDVAPTVMQLLEIDRGLAPDVQGRGLAASILKNSSPAPARLYAESHYPNTQFGWSPLRALISGRYKYVQAPTPELFDLHTDFAEKQNLAARDTALTNRLRKELEALEKRFAGDSAEAASSARPDSETLRKLQALGYVAGTSSPASTADSEALPDPKDQIGLYNQILGLFELSAQNRHQETIPGYLKVLQTQPSLRIVWYKLGQAYFFTGDYAQALEKFQRAIQLGGEDALATFDLAQTYLRLGRLEEALIGFQRTVEIDPEHYRARVNLGVVYKNQGKLAEAVLELEKAVQVAPDSAFALANLGVAYALAGRPEAGVEALLKAVRLRPDDARVRANLATVYLRMGKEEEARRELEKARQLDPNLFRRRAPPSQNPRQ